MRDSFLKPLPLLLFAERLKFSLSRQKAVLHGLEIGLFYSFLFTVFFSPVLVSDRLLAPGDGFVQSVPSFFSPVALWTELLFSGFPVTADPTVQSWYLLKLLFSQFQAWNGFVVSAYVLASGFTYGYVLTVTRSRFAGLVSGVAYGMSGFMMAHLGHTSILHSVVWLPLLIWALEKLRHGLTAHWFAAATLSIGFGALAGHPQIFVYIVGTGTAYAAFVGWSPAARRWRYYGTYVAAVAIGLSMAAIQLLPTVELASLGLRTHVSFADFVSYSLPPYQVVTLLFPYLLGGRSESLYRWNYFGDWNLTELTGYIGLLCPMLAVVGVACHRDRRLQWFWLGLGIVAFLMTLGDATPLARLMYHVPLYNKFRVPTRHFIELTFAISVLAGLGISAVQKRTVTRRWIRGTVALTGVAVLGGLGAIFMFSERLHGMAEERGVRGFSLTPWSNPATGVPLIVFLVTTGVFLYWSGNPRSGFRRLSLFSVLILDLGSFGWFCEWQYLAPGKELLAPSALAERYKRILDGTGQRMLPLWGGLGTMTELPANISRLWGVRSASGYGPFILSRISQLLSMQTNGRISDAWTLSSNRALDIMAVRYLFLPRRSMQPEGFMTRDGFVWSTVDLAVTLGSGCGIPHPSSVRFPLPKPERATSFGIVSSMSCSVDVLDLTEIARVRVTDLDGNVRVRSIRAGHDTSEWAYDCSDVRPHVNHDRAPIFRSFLVARKSSPECQGHHYLSVLDLGGTVRISSVELEAVGDSGAIDIVKLSLMDEVRGESYPISATGSALMDHGRWRHVEDIGETSVYENVRAMPRAWLVPEVVSLDPREALHAVRSSQMPDGRVYNPSRMALVEEPFAFRAGSLDPKRAARVTRSSDTQVQVHTISTAPSFLVLSDVYYPGWKATLDGLPARLFQTNFALRGVWVPAGEHIVRFEFEPNSVYAGAVISSASLLSLLGILSFGVFRKRRNAAIDG